MTIQVCFGSLWTYSPAAPHSRLSLAHLSSQNSHVHGLLRIVVNARVLPSLGYSAVDDVCFNAWLTELARASCRLVDSDPASYVYDEGEQGQPAFHFERSGSELFVSVRSSPLSDAPGDPDWERVPCRLDDFVGHVSRALREFQDALFAEAGPARARIWWQRFEERAGRHG